MFGGIDHVPESVRNAMKSKGYGKGSPLTARRIMAVNAVVQAELAKKVDFSELKKSTPRSASSLRTCEALADGHTEDMEI